VTTFETLPERAVQVPLVDPVALSFGAPDQARPVVAYVVAEEPAAVPAPVQAVAVVQEKPKLAAAAPAPVSSIAT